MEVTSIGGVPYAGGKAKINVGGMALTKIEIPEDATKIPDFKNAGITFEGELTIPEGVTYIGKYAFYKQTELWMVEFPAVLETIADYAFYGCETLSFDELPASLKTIGDYAFAKCGMMETVVLPEGLESLGKGVFRECSALKSASMLANITEVPDETFLGCTVLEKVYMPVDATRVGDFAFFCNDALDEVLLPKNLEEIGVCAFTHIVPYFGSNVTHFLSEVQYNLNQIEAGTSQDYPSLFVFDYGKSNLQGPLTKIVFPESLKTIGTGAFYMQGFSILDFPEGMSSIGSLAFAENYNLNSVTFPSTLTTIGAQAFSVTPNMIKYIYPVKLAKLNKVVIPDAVTSLGRYAFGRTIGEIIVGKGVTELPEMCVGYPGILTVGSGVSKMANNSVGFKYTYNDTETVRATKIIRMLGSKSPSVSAAFDLSTVDFDFINVYVPDGAKSRYTSNPRFKVFNIFEESDADIFVYVAQAPITEELKLQSGIAPSQVTKMTVTGKLADSDWRLIRENMISLSVLDLSNIENTALPNEALMGMNYLTEVILPKGLTYIGSRAFYNNSLMNTPEIPSGVETIGKEAFYGCSMLTITELPESLKTIGEHAFAYCTSLRSITAGENLEAIEPVKSEDYWGNEDYERNGWDDQWGTFAYCSSLEYVDLSATAIKSLPYQAFYNCGSLETVALPEAFEAIGNYAFKNSGLEYIDLPASVNEIGLQAFNGTKLRGIAMPEGVTEIGEKTFANCARLVSVNFPSSLENVGTLLFDNSLKVSGLTCPRVTAPAAATGAFTGMRVKKTTLTIPRQSYRDYLNAPQWGIFADLVNKMYVEIPADIEATIVNEAEYQEIQEEQEMKEMYESDESDEQPEVEAAPRRAGKQDLANGASYSRLFNNAVVASTTTPEGNRVFLDLGNKSVTKIELDGRDITSSFDGESFLIPGNAVGTLKITVSQSGIEAIEAEATIDGSTFCTAYDTTGRAVYSGIRAHLDQSVVPGIYIIKAGDLTEKVLVK